jgi:sucrose-6F-phosphate phosphohydrolase
MITINSPLLLACDLDRTVLPNGAQPTTPEALEEFRLLVGQEQVTLVYLTGRDLDLIKKAIKEYDLPLPKIAVGDVGTSIYNLDGDDFTEDLAWPKQIAQDWHGWKNPELAKLFVDFGELTPQEEAQQKDFKRSYYTPSDIAKAELVAKAQRLLVQNKIKAATIFSIDEANDTGLLDILPESATKKHALDFIREKLGFKHSEVIYAGDSGNDIEPLTSGYQSIVVKNAHSAVKVEVQKIAEEKGIVDQIYFAQGLSEKLNGNYSAGVVEGVSYFRGE